MYRRIELNIHLTLHIYVSSGLYTNTNSIAYNETGY